MIIKSPTNQYNVGKQVGNTSKYRLYLCNEKGTEHQCLLQIAADATLNGELERAAYILEELKRKSDELEVEYSTVKKDQEVFLNYDLGFPELMDSFICQEQGGRRINILAFRNVEDVSSMVPLINITAKDRQRVDLRTSAWIMGKLLKLLVFAHSQGISVGLLGGSNILIEPDEHYVLIFDWSVARTHSEAVPAETRREEISQAAQAVITVIGGNLETGVFPGDGEKGFKPYTEHLLRLARGCESNAERAHKNFYELIDSLWKREFYPFTTKLLD